MRKWLLILLMLPLVSGQTATMGLERELPANSFQTIGGPPGDVNTSCTAIEWEIRAESLYFFEDLDEIGCGYVVTPIVIPGQAKTASVVFDLDRNINTLVDDLSHHFVQQIKTFEGTAVKTYPIFEVRGGNQPSETREIEVAFEGSKIDLAWFFQDQGNSPAELGLEIGAPTGAAHWATLQNARIRFDGFPVEVSNTTTNRPIGNDIEKILSLKIDVPEPDAGLGIDKPFVEVLVDPDFFLFSLRGPDGSKLNSTEMQELTSRPGYLEIPSRIIASHGVGTYTIEFISVDFVSPEAYLGPVAVLAFVFPFAGILLSYREYRHTRYRIGDDPIVNSGMTWLWRATVFVIILSMGWILISRRVVGMLYWPPNVEEVLYYSILIGTGGFMFLYMFLWRRQALMVALDKEIHVRRRTQDTLEQSNRDLEMFAYVASHDMKQPLRMVKFYTRRLKEKYGDKLDKDAQDYIDFAADNAERMEALVQGLLEYSRVDGAKFLPDAINMNAVVAGAEANLQLLLDESGGVLTWDDLGEVKGNFTQLSQLLQNLIENGLKYRSEAAPRIHVSRDGQKFTVTDNGVGIPPKDQARVFKLFKQLDVDHDGEGIGLALCRRIVEKHGGTILAKSNPEGGTIIEFTLK